jgi:hypothetical protein
MTNTVEQITNVVSVTTHLTPQQAAYTFKEWAGVLGMIFTSLYTSGHVVFVSVTHYGGLRKMGNDFWGPKLPQAAAEQTKQ